VEKKGDQFPEKGGFPSWQLFLFIAQTVAAHCLTAIRSLLGREREGEEQPEWRGSAGLLKAKKLLSPPDDCLVAGEDSDGRALVIALLLPSGQVAATLANLA